MNLSLLVHQDTLVARVYGPFNQSGGKKILRLLKRGKIHTYSTLVFDLNHASSIDSFGLGIIFLVAHRLRQTGGRTLVVNPQPQVRESLERADLPSMVEMHPTEKRGLVAA